METVYLIRRVEDGGYYRTGRNYTVSTYTHLGAAKAQLTKLNRKKEKFEIVEINSVKVLDI